MVRGPSELVITMTIVMTAHAKILTSEGNVRGKVDLTKLNKPFGHDPRRVSNKKLPRGRLRCHATKHQKVRDK